MISSTLSLLSESLESKSLTSLRQRFYSHEQTSFFEGGYALRRDDEKHISTDIDDFDGLNNDFDCDIIDNGTTDQKKAATSSNISDSNYAVNNNDNSYTNNDNIPHHKVQQKALLNLGDSLDECDDTPPLPVRAAQRPLVAPPRPAPMPISPPSINQSLIAADSAKRTAAPVVVTTGREFSPESTNEEGSDLSFPTEIFRYKVVYPGGVCVRVSPAIDAEKTGDVLEYGSTFRSNKSLFLDGVNYCKIADYDGWVFSSIDATEVLQLLEVARTPVKPHTTQAISLTPVACATPSRAIAAAGGGNSPKADRAGNIALLMSPEVLSRKLGGYSASQHAHTPQSSTAQLEKRRLFDANRAQNRFWREVRAACGDCSGFDDFVLLAVGISHAISDEKAGGDERLAGLLSIITSITKQCADSQVDLDGLEPALWVLTHVGTRVGHIMTLVVEAANERFDRIGAANQKNLLCIVLEVGQRTKAQCVEVGRASDMLPDDLRNFLQRWVILRFNEPDPTLFSRSSDSEDSLAVVRTPVAGSVGGSVGGWFADLLCSSGSSPFAPRGVVDFSAGSLAAGERQEGSYSRLKFWSVVEREMKRITNPELQSALF